MERDVRQSTENTLMYHLVELRSRLIRCIVATVIVVLVLSPFSDTIYLFLAEPMLEQLPAQGSLVATKVASPFLTPFKLLLFLSFLVALPFILFQIWAFIAPGLYDSERRLIFPLVFSTTVLFYLGILFAYYVIFPIIFAFFASTTPEGVNLMTDISEYLSFCIKLFLAFGLAFEVPLVTFVLIRSGLTTIEAMRKKRPYIILVAFILGMLLTPPDFVSQILLALPIWMLFEIALILTSILGGGVTNNQ
ncbi:MAG: twin-arginine translocase subunit TatC [Pseudomonadota bacterium]|nr:twin-arginine translocase subunit TatC [Pseudomonadota bacterium]